MDTKKLAKIIKVIVEQEVKRQLPALIKEGVANEFKKMNVEQVIKTKPKVEEEIDPFSLASAMLDEDRLKNHGKEEVKKKRHFTKNTVLNEILNNTTPFGQEAREGTSVLDKTVLMDSNIAPAGIDGLRSQMAQKMGYGDVSPNTSPKTAGLGVTTGLPALDRILNRDNSELVKKFATRK